MPDPPAEIPGTIPAGPRDIKAITRWQRDAKTYTAKELWKKRHLGRDLLFVLYLRALWPLIGWIVRREVKQYVHGAPRRRLFMTPGRDACLGVTATTTGWTLNTHFTAEPGTGRARQLRRNVCTQMGAAADQQGVTITFIAATEALARGYRREWPDLVDDGRAVGSGRTLRRDPRPRSDELP